MKKWTIIVAIFISIFAITIGCQRRASTKEEIYKEFQKKIVTMSSYKCIAEVEAIGNKSSHNYVFVHSYNKPDYYKLEVVEPKHLKGKTMEYKDDKVIIGRTTKTYAGQRELPIPKFLIPYVTEQMQVAINNRNPEKLLFVNNKKQPVDSANVNYTLKKMLKNA